LGVGLDVRGIGFGLKQDYYQCAILLSIIIPVLFNCTCANYNTIYYS